jgi:predicted transcriptional regulator
MTHSCAGRVLHEILSDYPALARSLERDVKSVHRDVRVLIEQRLVEKDGDGKLVVPFDRIHAEFDLQRKAA